MALFVDTIINVRKIVKKFAPSNQMLSEAVNDMSWTGVCQEILDALYGDEDHHVEIVDGRYCIWRKYSSPSGSSVIGMPAFIQVSGNKFVSTYWKRRYREWSDEDIC